MYDNEKFEKCAEAAGIKLENIQRFREALSGKLEVKKTQISNIRTLTKDVSPMMRLRELQRAGYSCIDSLTNPQHYSIQETTFSKNRRILDLICWTINIPTSDGKKWPLPDEINERLKFTPRGYSHNRTTDFKPYILEIK